MGELIGRVPFLDALRDPKDPTATVLKDRKRQLDRETFLRAYSQPFTDEPKDRLLRMKQLADAGLPVQLNRRDPAQIDSFVQGRSTFLSDENIASIRENSPIFFSEYTKNPNLVRALLPDKMESVSLFERIKSIPRGVADLAKDAVLAGKQGSGQLQLAFMRNKQVMLHLRGEQMSQHDLALLDLAHAEMGLREFDIARGLDDRVRGIGIGNAIVRATEQIPNLAFILAFRQAGKVIFGGAAGAAGTLGAPDPTDVVTVPPAVLAGQKFGAATGVFTAASMLEFGLLMDEIVRQQEIEGRPANLDDAIAVALPGAMLNGLAEVFTVELFLRAFPMPKGLKVRMEGASIRSAFRQLMTNPTTRDQVARFWRSYVTAIGGEGATEAFQRAVNNTAAEMERQQGTDGATFAEFLRFIASNDVLSGTMSEAIEAMQATAALIGIPAGGSRAVRSFAGVDNQQSKLDLLKQDDAIDRTVQAQEFMGDVEEFIEANKEFFENNPEEAAKLIEAVLKNSSVEDIRLDAQAVEKDIQENPDNEALYQAAVPNFDEQIQTQPEAGGDIVVKTDQYIAKLMPTKVHETMKDHIRIEEGDPTVGEIAEHEAAFTEVLERDRRIESEQDDLDREIEELGSRVEEQALAAFDDPTAEDRQQIKDFATIVRTHIAVEAVRTGRSISEIEAETLKGGIVRSTEEAAQGDVRLFQAVKGEDTEAPKPAPKKILGFFDPGGLQIGFTPRANLSTMIHEGGHAFAFATFNKALNGDEQAQSDVDTLVEWLGVSGIEDILIRPGDSDAVKKQKVAHHEKIADGFVAFMSEGKAPTPELQDMFNRLRIWLLELYAQMRIQRVELSDEVREVFGRWLAAESEIKAAAATLRMDPRSQEDLGMTDEEYAAHRAAVDAAKAAALRVRQAQITKQANKKKAQKFRKREREVRKEVKERVEQFPVYRAMRALSTGTIVDEEGNTPTFPGATGAKIKMDRDAAVAINPETPVRFTTKTGGAHPDELAGVFNFGSGAQMLHEIVKAPKVDEVVAGEVNRIMDAEIAEDDTMARSDDPTTPEAADALHNKAWETVLVAELAALSKVTGRKRIRTDLMKAEAKRRIGAMSIAEARPERFLRNERKAATTLERTLEKGDREGARIAAQQRLVNAFLYNEALAMHRRNEKDIRHFRTYRKKSKLKGVDPEFKAHILRVLGMYDLRSRPDKPGEQPEVPVDPAVDLRTLLQDARENNFPVRIDDDDVVFVTKRTPWTALTTDELHALRLAVDNLFGIGRSLHRLILVPGEIIQKEDAVADLTEQLATTHEPKDAPVSIREVGERRHFLTVMLQETRRRANVARVIDGFKDGGTWWNIFIRPVNIAADNKTQRMIAEAERSHALFRDYTRRELADTVFIPTTGKTWSREELLVIALNWGNEGNRSRVLDVNGISEDNIGDVLSSISEKDWNAAQKAGKYLESFWGEVSDLERRNAGRTPERVEPTPFETKFGTFDGWYYPIVYDSRLSIKAASDEIRERSREGTQVFGAAAQTRHGYTKARTNSGGRKLRLQLTGFYGHVEDVIHDLTHREVVQGLSSLLNDRRLKGEIESRLGVEEHKQFIFWLQRIAVGDQVARTQFERALGALRSKATIMGLGFRMSTALLQFTGYTQSVVRIGPRWALNGMGAAMAGLGNPNQMMKPIWAKSDFMKTRGLTFHRDLRDRQTELSRRGGKVNLFMNKMVFAPIATAQLFVDVPTWLGAYNKALDANNSDERAAQIADQAVVDSQGSGLTKDLSKLEGGSPLVRLWTTFWTFFGTTFNMSADEFHRIMRNDEAFAVKMAQAASTFMLLIFIPATVNELMLQRGPDPDEDEGKWVKWLLANNASYLLALNPLSREITPAFHGYQYSGPAGTRPIKEVIEGITSAKKIIESIVTDDRTFADDEYFEIDNIFGILSDKDFRDLMELVATIPGTPPIPSGQIGATLRGLQRIEDDETEGTLDALSGLLLGRGLKSNE